MIIIFSSTAISAIIIVLLMLLHLSGYAVMAILEWICPFISLAIVGVVILYNIIIFLEYQNIVRTILLILLDVFIGHFVIMPFIVLVGECAAEFINNGLFEGILGVIDFFIVLIPVGLVCGGSFLLYFLIRSDMDQIATGKIKVQNKNIIGELIFASLAVIVACEIVWCIYTALGTCNDLNYYVEFFPKPVIYVIGSVYRFLTGIVF